MFHSGLSLYEMYAGALAAAKQLLAGPEKNSSIFFKSLVILIFLVHHTAAEAIKTPDPLQKHLVTISLVLDLMALLMSSFLNHAGNLEILDGPRKARDEALLKRHDDCCRCTGLFSGHKPPRAKKPTPIFVHSI